MARSVARPRAAAKARLGLTPAEMITRPASRARPSFRTTLSTWRKPSRRAAWARSSKSRPAAESFRRRRAAPRGVVWRGRTRSPISRTVRWRPRLTRARPVSRPKSPPPMITARFLSLTARERVQASFKLRTTKTFSSRSPGRGGRLASPPTARSSRSKVWRLPVEPRMVRAERFRSTSFSPSRRSSRRSSYQDWGWT